MLGGGGGKVGRLTRGKRLQLMGRDWNRAVFEWHGLTVPGDFVSRNDEDHADRFIESCSEVNSDGLKDRTDYCQRVTLFSLDNSIFLVFVNSVALGRLLFLFLNTEELDTLQSNSF